MRLVLDVDHAGGRRFHRLLRDRLARRFPGASVALHAVEGAPPLPGAVAALLAIERMILRRSRETLCDGLSPREFGAPPAGAPDIALDLSGRATSGAGAALTLRPLYDGAPADAAMIGALIGGRAPEIAIENVATGHILCAGTPSLEAADGLTGGMEAVYSRVMILIEQAIRAPEKSLPRTQVQTHAASARDLARYGLKGQIGQLVRRIYHLCCYAPHWRVGWRVHDGPGVMELGHLGGPRWNVLADPGHRFYADPFPITRDGRSYLFFEDLDHHVGKGIISAVEFGPDGPIGAVFPVLEEPWHMSYPFLIEAEGQLWMVPESSKSGQATLYRCVEFPKRWERSAALLEGIEAADATILQHDGLFYMMSAVREDLGGYSDTLAIHVASKIAGPWRAHAANSALIDAGAARPAGAIVRKEGALWRPVQDCTHGYGRALRLARIDRLDPEGFAQTLGPPIGSGPLWPGGRLHTLNRAGSLEVIDGVAINPKLRLMRGLVAKRLEPRESAPAGVSA
ncbi:hypothetical protein [Methylocapsa sp. S129]|uniref:glucosamine inositolphosphorylceramide transferase family protein n=1 Tax=Methylocapsa sp. S129 TaxID=1641869 RepID=UPI00131B0711|nr:hypothetical protein [Methylocapsa sp. S129]